MATKPVQLPTAHPRSIPTRRTRQASEPFGFIDGPADKKRDKEERRKRGLVNAGGYAAVAFVVALVILGVIVLSGEIKQRVDLVVAMVTIMIVTTGVMLRAEQGHR